MMFYSYTNDQGRESLTVHCPGISAVIPGSHPRFHQLLSYLEQHSTDPDPDLEHIRALLNPGRSLAACLPGSRVSFDGRDLRFDGEVIDGSLSRHIVRMMREGDEENYPRWVMFCEQLAQNPSADSREHLFTWLAGRDFAITPQGHLLGYKGVQADSSNSSLHSGQALVNGTLYKGHIPNPAGAAVEMPRDQVCADRGTGCAPGLHVGTFAYAKSYGRQRVLLVAVNPADAVSVPAESGCQKLRCCRYRVLSVYEGSEPVPAASYDGVELDTSHPAERA